MKSTDNSFIDDLLNNTGLSIELQSDIKSKLVLKRIKKRELIQDKGQIQQYLYIFEKGIARHYFAELQKEFTLWFSMEGDFVANSGFFTQKPVNEHIVALTDIKAYALHYSNFEILCNKSHEFERFVRNTLAEQLFLYDKYYAENFMFSATERYNNFVNQFPEIVKRVPLIYIASFLGITPETLSRIRAVRK